MSDGDLKTPYLYRIVGSGPDVYRGRGGFKPYIQLSQADIRTVVRLFFSLPFASLPKNFFTFEGGTGPKVRGIKPYLQSVMVGSKVVKVVNFSDPSRIQTEIKIKVSQLKPEDFFEYIRATKNTDTSHISFDTSLRCGDLEGKYKYKVDISDLTSYKVTVDRLGGQQKCPGLKAVLLMGYKKFRLCMDNEFLERANVIGLDVEISSTHRDIYFFTEIGIKRILASMRVGSNEWVPFHQQSSLGLRKPPPRPLTPHPHLKRI